MIDNIVLPKKDLLILKNAELTLVRLLNTVKTRSFQDELTEIVVLIRRVGAMCKTCRLSEKCGDD